MSWVLKHKTDYQYPEKKHSLLPTGHQDEVDTQEKDTQLTRGF